jgi:ATP-dependent Lon protease
MFLGVGVAWWVQIQQAFKAQDASFTITVSGVERSSMQQVFSERLYAVADGDVLWDRQFEDQIHTDQYGRSVFYSNHLSRLKPLEVAGDVNTQDEASNNNHRKKPKVQ